LDNAVLPEITPEIGAHLQRIHIEWHVVPSAAVVPFDDAYLDRLYPRRPADFESSRFHSRSVRSLMEFGHARHQGQLIGVETTMKPNYLPENRQAYGTKYGFDVTADPLAEYLEHGTRYAHSYTSMRDLGERINQEWRSRGLLPKGYRFTLCPPAVLNLIGNVFHPEWSETQSLELSFYRDEHGNATCYAVGSNERGDFSYIHEVDTNVEWTYLGFRTALVPEIR
jgi:hypothetical protein